MLILLEILRFAVRHFTEQHEMQLQRNATVKTVANLVKMVSFFHLFFQFTAITLLPNSYYTNKQTETDELRIQTSCRSHDCRWLG